MSFVGHGLVILFLCWQIVILSPFQPANTTSTHIFKISLIKPVTKPSTKPTPVLMHEEIKPQPKTTSPLPALLPPVKPLSDAIEYLDSAQLSMSPRPQGNLSDALAPGLKGVASQTLLLRLQISKSGDVDHVIPDQGNLSDIEQQQLVDTLFTIKFTPGRMGDKPVYSEIGIAIKIKNDTISATVK
jgi:hypothetical protein